jgi:hypothetical protein
MSIGGVHQMFVLSLSLSILSPLRGPLSYSLARPDTLAHASPLAYSCTLAHACTVLLLRLALLLMLKLTRTDI